MKFLVFKFSSIKQEYKKANETGFKTKYQSSKYTISGFNRG